MRTPRQISVHRAMLQALANIPEGYLLTTDLLVAEASRLVLPRPSRAELEAEIAHADAIRRIDGVPTEEGQKWALADAGRLWLQTHP